MLRDSVLITPVESSYTYDAATRLRNDQRRFWVQQDAHRENPLRYSFIIGTSSAIAQLISGHAAGLPHDAEAAPSSWNDDSPLSCLSRPRRAAAELNSAGPPRGALHGPAGRRPLHDGHRGQAARNRTRIPFRRAHPPPILRPRRKKHPQPPRSNSATCTLPALRLETARLPAHCAKLVSLIVRCAKS